MATNAELEKRVKKLESSVLELQHILYALMPTVLDLCVTRTSDGKHIIFYEQRQNRWDEVSNQDMLENLRVVEMFNKVWHEETENTNSNSE